MYAITSSSSALEVMSFALSKEVSGTGNHSSPPPDAIEVSEAAEEDTVAEVVEGVEVSHVNSIKPKSQPVKVKTTAMTSNNEIIIFFKTLFP
jgi:hypothetical protein